MNSDIAIELAEGRRRAFGSFQNKNFRLVGVRLGPYSCLPDGEFVITGVMRSVHDCFTAENYRLDAILGPPNSPMAQYFDRLKPQTYFPIEFIWNLTTMRHVPDGIGGLYTIDPIHTCCIAVFGPDTVYAVEYTNAVDKP